MVRIRTIRGKKVPLPGSDTSGPSDPRKPSKNSTSSPYDDEYNRIRQEEFLRMKKEQFKKKVKQSKAKKKQARFERVASLNLGNARQFLILTTPVLVQLDPYLMILYSTWKFGRYGYRIYQKVKREYDVNGDYPQALQNVVEQEIEEKVISKVKSIPIKNILQFAANRIWEIHKESNPDISISPEWDNFAVSAMTKTFKEIGDMAL